MNYCTYDQQGRITSVGCCSDDLRLENFQHFTEFVMLGTSDDVTCETHYVDISVGSPVIRELPACPGECYEFDYATCTWGPKRQEAIAVRKSELVTERVRRNYLPITHDGVTLDADAIAQRNLSDKKQEAEERLRLGIDMPSDLLIWKDYDNVLHTFDTLQDYLDFISGFVIALAERGTRIYVAYWTHKENIDALITVEDVLAYDITAGWPE